MKMTRLIFVPLAALLPILSNGAEPAPLGRLFLNPAERAQLDQARQNNGTATAAGGSQAAAVPATNQITLNGFVKRSSGKDTTWINQVPQNEFDNPQGIAVMKQVGQARALSLQLPSGKRVDLKAGQTFDAGKGTVREDYQMPSAPLKTAQ